MQRILCLLASVAMVSACPDWSSFGGDDDDDTGEGEGEGEGGEGEGEEGEGEGEGEGLDGIRWGVIGVDVTAQAELANGTARRLSSSQGRLFAVGPEAVFELLDDALETVAEVAVPCTDAELTGPVAVDGTDLLVGSLHGAVRFHEDGSCDPAYAPGGQTFQSGIAAPLAGGALVYDGQVLYLVDGQGVVVDDHAFDDFIEGELVPDGDTDALFLVRGAVNSPGQVVRITKPGTEIVIAVEDSTASMRAGSTPVTVTGATRFEAFYLDVTVGDDVAELRLDDSDSLRAIAADANGEIAVVGSSALVAIASTTAPTMELLSVTGTRFGAISRLEISPSGEVWGLGTSTLLYWTADAAERLASPDIVHLDETVFVGTEVAIDGSLFFAGENRNLKRADVVDGALEIVNLVDNVTFADVPLDFGAHLAFVPSETQEPPRIVAVAPNVVRSFELTDDLGAVTARLQDSSFTGSFFNTVTALEVLDDASKAAFVVNSTLFTCAIELPVGLAPEVVCDAGRSSGVSNGSHVRILDPIVGVDDETFVIAGSGAVGIVEPGESGRAFTMQVDGTAPALLVEGCVLAFSSSQESWRALNQEQPDASAGRRAFGIVDAVVLGGNVLVAGPADGSAGQLAHFPAPATATCADATGAPVLEGAGMFGGELRSQGDIVAAAFVAGELYVLDEDGLVWHVPTP